MPCPHCKITIIKRNNNESAVSAAAYQSGEKLFSEYDQEQKSYPYKTEVTHKEIMLPPPCAGGICRPQCLMELCRSAGKTMELPTSPEVRACLQGKSHQNSMPTLSVTTAGSFFVSKGMIADFAIHDKGGGNPHAHILLTVRAMDEKGKWLPKSRKVYDLDKNGERIRLASGRWKSHKENTVDWNDRKYAEIWRQGWADMANRYLEANDRPERLDLRSYLLRRWKEEHAPRQPDEAWNPRFVEALQNMSRVEYLMDVLLSGELSERLYAGGHQSRDDSGFP